MSRNQVACDLCGTPAVVHIGGDMEMHPRLRHLCAACADAEELARPDRDRRLDHAAVLVAVGFSILFISVFADVLAFGGSEGFGWKQWAGMALAGILVMVGVAMWIPTVLVIGLFVGGLTALADYLGFGNASGFGLQQIGGALLGLGMVMVGFKTARHH